MKTLRVLLLLCLAVTLPGCVSIPPLIQVQHKEASDNYSSSDVMKRLDAIDRRLDRLEAKIEK